MKKEIRWVIVGNCGLYTGQWLTRKRAIEVHTWELGKTWAECQKNGDRAVKAEISWEAPDAK